MLPSFPFPLVTFHRGGGGCAGGNRVFIDLSFSLNLLEIHYAEGLFNMNEA